MEKKKKTSSIIILVVLAVVAGVAIWLILRKKKYTAKETCPVVKIYKESDGGYTQELVNWVSEGTEVTVDGSYTDSLGDAYWHVTAPYEGYVLKSYLK